MARDIDRVIVYLTTAEKRQLKIIAAESDLTITDLVAGVLRRSLLNVIAGEDCPTGSGGVS